MENTCVFCRIIRKELPASVVLENDHVIAIMDIQPINEGHVLVMPKHCVQFLHQLTEEQAVEVFKAVKAIEKSLWQIDGIACEGTNILQNNGRSAWQEVNHVHFHIIPRFAGDGFRIKYQPKKPEREALNQLAAEIRGRI